VIRFDDKPDESWSGGTFADGIGNERLLFSCSHACGGFFPASARTSSNTEIRVTRGDNAFSLRKGKSKWQRL